MRTPEQIKEYQRNYYKLHKAEYAARDREWSKRNRKKRVQFSLKYRAKNRQRYDDYNRRYGAEYRKTHKQKLLAQNRKCGKDWYRRNKQRVSEKVAKRRALKAQATVNLRSISKWQGAVRANKTFRCYWCDHVKLIALLHFDHIVPLDKAGQHCVENLCTSCSACNWSKGSKLIGEWYRAGQLVLGL